MYGEQRGANPSIVIHIQNAIADTAADEWTMHLDAHLDIVRINGTAAEGERAVAIAVSNRGIILNLAASESDLVNQGIHLRARQVHSPPRLVAGEKSKEVVCCVHVKLVAKFPRNLAPGSGRIAESYGRINQPGLKIDETDRLMHANSDLIGIHVVH